MRPQLDRRSIVQRSLQEATEDIKAKLSSKDDHAKASVRDPPDLMREKALFCCDEPPSIWRDTKKPSVLQTWNAYWEKDYFCKREGYFYYKAYTGQTRVLKLDPFATITEVKAAIEHKEGAKLPTGFLTSGATVLAKEDLDLNEYNVRPGSFFELPSRLYGGGSIVSTTQGSDRATTPIVESIAALEGNLPEGDAPEHIRAELNSPSPHSDQDHKGLEADAGPEHENEADTTNAARKTSPVQRAVSLRWLQQFAAQYRGECFTFARQEFADDAHGGGNKHGIDVNVEQLAGFRSARRSAEKAGTCKPVIVRYVNIPFEEMTTADVMEAIIRPMCRQKHKSFAEAVVMSDNIGSLGDPTYFVSTSPNSGVDVYM